MPSAPPSLYLSPNSISDRRTLYGLAAEQKAHQKNQPVGGVPWPASLLNTFVCFLTFLNANASSSAGEAHQGFLISTRPPLILPFSRLFFFFSSAHDPAFWLVLEFECKLWRNYVGMYNNVVYAHTSVLVRLHRLIYVCMSTIRFEMLI